PLAVISTFMAKRLWPGESPIGKTFRMGPPTLSLFQTVFEVVGVVGDIHTEALTADFAETLYVPYWMNLSFANNWSFVFKTTDAGGSARQVRSALRELDPQLPIPAFRTLGEIMSRSTSQRRFQLNVILMFAIAGLLLASVGIYGLVSYSVVQRT